MNLQNFWKKKQKNFNENAFLREKQIIDNEFSQSKYLLQTKHQQNLIDLEIEFDIVSQENDDDTFSKKLALNQQYEEGLNFLRQKAEFLSKNHLNHEHLDYLLFNIEETINKFNSNQI